MPDPSGIEKRRAGPRKRGLVPPKAVPGAFKPGDDTGIPRWGARRGGPPSPLSLLTIHSRKEFHIDRNPSWGISTVGRTKVNLLTPTDGEAFIAPTTMDDRKSGRKSSQMGH